ncbi:Uncharacterized protein FWK35_00018613 [Aphis craccivora]|uniref:Uncharacterized protein n=1 Tax=Aphis craccivora TaxID=307492 RepID=A0A6G0YCB2_APHCR|nr:Uncharacterized protein FWK35_00018613 [Aphis craccivora]
MMNTKASRNKLILKLARKNPTIISSSCSTRQIQSTWELVHAENELSHYSEIQYIDQMSKEKVLNWLENKETTFVNNIVDSSQCALKSAEYDYEQDKDPTIINNIVDSSQCAPDYIDDSEHKSSSVNKDNSSQNIRAHSNNSSGYSSSQSTHPNIDVQNAPATTKDKKRLRRNPVLFLNTDIVCKQFFKSTLSISDRPIRTVSSKTDGGILSVDFRDKHGHHFHLDKNIKKTVRKHIETIPRIIESHYCRQVSTREFIYGTKIVAQLHRHYDQCEDCVAFTNSDENEKEIFFLVHSNKLPK